MLTQCEMFGLLMRHELRLRVRMKENETHLITGIAVVKTGPVPRRYIPLVLFIEMRKREIHIWEKMLKKSRGEGSFLISERSDKG